MNPPPTITHLAARETFRSLALRQGHDPDGVWTGGYVDYEWEHARHVFESRGAALAGARVLEFGCNLGATSIVLAACGATVTGVDVSLASVDLARANAACYQVSGSVEFIHVPDTRALPFAAQEFDFISCNSVLEYVPPPLLPAVQQEIDRTLKIGGVIYITGTSNRLAPREVQSQKWLTNYLPRAWDTVLFRGRSIQRGVFPHQIRRGFGDYENLDWIDGGAGFLESRRRMGMSRAKLALLATANRLLHPLGLTVGLITPSLSVTLRKRSATA